MTDLFGGNLASRLTREATDVNATRMRAELEFSEQSLRLATEAAEVGTWDLELVTDVLTWSDRTRAMFGISPGVPCSMSDFYAGLHPEDHEATSVAFASALDPARRATYDVEYRVVGREDGIVRWVAAKGRGLFADNGRCVRALGTAIDITVRKAAEERLRTSEALLAESERKFRAITDSIGHMVWSSTPSGLHDFYNQRWYDYTGVLRGSTDAAAWTDMLHEADRDRAWARWQHCLQTGEQYEIEHRLRHSSGEYRWVLGRAVPLHDDHGRIVRWFGTCTDIQEIVEAREVLARSREQLEREVAERTLERDRTWRNSQDLLVVLDAHGILRAVNPAWTSVLGWQPNELLGHSYFALIHPDDRILSEAALRSATGDGLPRYENRFRHKDGSYRWIAWVASPEADLIYASGRHVNVEKEAARALARAEDQLRQSQKMEAIGQLTGGIAHDFNNLLAGIIGSLELMQRRIATGRLDSLDRYSSMAITSAQRAAGLTQRLLAFARRQPLDPKRVEANRLVASMEDLLRRTLGPAVDLEMVLAGGLWPTLCDPNQLENAILNLAINARDAMPDGGRLTVETANAHLDDAYARAQGGDVKPGQYIAVSVTDTGVGMAPEIIEKAFDPFFTTKPTGQGTGLGLSMLYGFIKQSEGHVRIYSEMGRGTTFKVYLPRHRGAADVEPAELAADTVSTLQATAGETVLVVDDEITVRVLVIEILEELGYSAIEAADGPHGLRILQSDARIDLLVTDVGLPGLNGRQLADAARESRPGLRVLFMTGYAHNAAVGTGSALEPGMEIISKPFALDTLAKKIRAMIEPA